MSAGTALAEPSVERTVHSEIDRLNEQVERLELAAENLHSGVFGPEPTAGPDLAADSRGALVDRVDRVSGRVETVIGRLHQVRDTIG